MTEALYLFLGLLTISLVIGRQPWFRQQACLLGDWLQIHAFPDQPEFEEYKFAILRVLFGCILVYRAFLVIAYLTAGDYASPVAWWAIAELVAGMLLVLGLLTQWSLIFLLLAMWHTGDSVVAKDTLGNDVGALFGLLLFLVNAGKYLSLDAWIVNRWATMRYVLLYYTGAASNRDKALAKLATLGGYWAVCVYSLAMHLVEPAWTTGVAGPLLLTNNFMSAWYTEFTTLFTNSDLATFLARLSLWIMMLWYVAVLPFVLWGSWARLYVIVWGWLFFAFSLFILNLGFLAEIEILFWLALFWVKPGMNGHRVLNIFYDDRCNLCDKTVQVITLLDRFRVARLRPVSQNLTQLEEIGISHEHAMTDLHGMDESTGAITGGYDFYLELCRRVMLLWPILPVLMVGKWLGFGPLVYRFIARRRVKMFGVCELPRKKYQVSTDRSLGKNTYVPGITLHVFISIFLYLVAVVAPYQNTQAIGSIAAMSAHYYGVAPINVFNRTDLRIAENWFVLTSSDFGEIVPLLAYDGSRLDMHHSDRIYFGHTVKFRRYVIGKSGCHLEQWKATINYLLESYLTRKNAVPGRYQFQYEQFKQPLPEWDRLLENRYVENATQRICNEQILLDFQG